MKIFIFRSREWMAEIVRTMADTGSIWTKDHPYGSYAPQRKSVPARWYEILSLFRSN